MLVWLRTSPADCRCICLCLPPPSLAIAAHCCLRLSLQAFFIRRDLQVAKQKALVAEDAGGICGTVQLILNLPENQPHRADLAKMLVHSRARRRGLGESLMRAAESMAQDCARTLLVLDAVTGGDAERLYERLGWQRVGVIPDFALFPDGRMCATTFFYRRIPG